MQVRLGFSIATALEPDVLLLDEVLAVGDAAFRTKCFQRIGRVLESAAVIFVSHDAVQVSRICDSGLYLKNGTLAGIGPTEEILELYQSDQPSSSSVRSIVLDSAVTDFNCAPERAHVGWGETLEVLVRLKVDGRRIGLALLTLL